MFEIRNNKFCHVCGRRDQVNHSATVCLASYSSAGFSYRHTRHPGKELAITLIMEKSDPDY